MSPLDLQVCVRIITKEEQQEILSILDDYELYTRTSPCTLLPHYYGIISMWGNGQQEVTFLVTRNPFHTVESVDMIFEVRASEMVSCFLVLACGRCCV